MTEQLRQLRHLLTCEWNFPPRVETVLASRSTLIFPCFFFLSVRACVRARARALACVCVCVCVCVNKTSARKLECSRFAHFSATDRTYSGTYFQVDSSF